jgi:hypothetical protein
VRTSLPVTTEEYVEIQQILSLYGHIFDAQAWDDLHMVFTDDCVVDYGSSGRGRLEGIEELKEHMTVSPPLVLCHMFTNLYLSREDHGLRATSSLLGAVPDGPPLTGHYEDRLQLTSSGWRIAERVVHLRRTLEEVYGAQQRGGVG